MKLQAVSVCVNYADFFRETGKANQGVFDKFVIVTDLADTEVSALCEEYGYDLVKTDVFYENGASFNKYAGINEGLKLIDDDAWVCFIDSDIVMQPDTKRVLTELDLDETFMYGIDRVNCVGYENWDAYKNSRGVLEHNWMLTPAGMPMGARLVHYYGHEGENGKFEGWRPLGFCQIVKRKMFNLYPQETMGADHCDLLFARQWKRNKRSHIPELLAVHLESKSADNGVNWHGRKSDPFVPKAKRIPPAPPEGIEIREWQIPRSCSELLEERAIIEKQIKAQVIDYGDPKPKPESKFLENLIGTIFIAGFLAYAVYRFFYG